MNSVRELPEPLGQGCYISPALGIPGAQLSVVEALDDDPQVVQVSRTEVGASPLVWEGGGLELGGPDGGTVSGGQGTGTVN